MADGRHLEKIEKLPYLGDGMTDRHEICHDDAVWPSCRSNSNNFKKIQIQDGGVRHLEKSKNRHEIWQSQVDHLDHSDRQISDRKFHTCALKNDTVGDNGLRYGADTTFHRTHS